MVVYAENAFLAKVDFVFAPVPQVATAVGARLWMCMDIAISSSYQHEKNRIDK